MYATPAVSNREPSILDVTTEDFDATMKTNIYAPFWIIKAALPHLEPGSSMLKDHYRTTLVRIMRKQKAKRPTHSPPVKPAPENVVNLMVALRRSIAAEKRAAAKSTTRRNLARSPAKRRARPESAMRTAKENDRMVRSPHGQNVIVECLTCGHTAVLTPQALPAFQCGPKAPIAAFVKRLRCHRCGSHCSLLSARARGELPIVGFDERPANRQTPSHALRFCREEGVEDMVDIFGSKPRPRVAVINTLSGANDMELTRS